MLPKRILGLAYLSVMGLLIGSVALFHLLEPGEPFLGRVLSFAALVGLAAPLLWSAWWLWTQSFAAARVWRAVRWSVAGVGSLTLLAVITVLYEGSHGVFLADAAVITLWVAGTGATAGIIIGLYDLRHQLQLEEAQQTATHLSTVLETLPVALIEIDRAGAVTRWNPAAEQTFGWSEDEVRGDRLPIIPEDNGVREEWMEIVDQERSVAGVEMFCAGQNRIQITGRVWATPLQDITGDIIGTILIIIDVTAETRRRQHLDVTNRILRHNLRNEVTIIQGNTSLLQEEVSDPELQSKITTIMDSARRLERVSESARDLRHALTAETASQQACDIVPLIERIRDEIQQRNPDVILTVTAPDAAWAAVDPTIELAIREAVENAVEHTDRADPTIEIDVSVLGEQTDPSSVEITISDEGPGIPEQERIPLEEESITPLQHGSGLGLWLIKWITNHNGGTVTITENDPRGTVVTLTLPAAPPATTPVNETT